MHVSYNNILVKTVLLVLFTSTASSDLWNESKSARQLPANCVEAVRSAGSSAKSGIYRIRLSLDGWEHRPFYVYCLLDGNGGDAWLLVQRRQNKNIDFYRNWTDYKLGFGNLETSFFIGLDKLHALTQAQLNELQIELRDFDDTVKYANYASFAVGDENEKYALNILGAYTGNAGDALLGYHDGEKFSTHDQDNDRWTANCAALYKAAWWYKHCNLSNLNGMYLNGAHANTTEGINWGPWHGYHYSLKYTHMAIRPIDRVDVRGQRS